MAQVFFASDAVQKTISRVLKTLDGSAGERGQHVCGVLRVIQNNPDAFDERCQVNIDFIGDSITSGLHALAVEGEGDPTAIDELISMLFRVVAEFEISHVGELSRDLRTFLSWVHDNASQLGGNASRQVDFARHRMPVSIVKALLGSDVVRNLPNIQTFTAGVESKFKAWSEDLTSREARVNALQEALTKHESGFNFVGLHEGFNDLSKTKKQEVTGLRRYVVLLGIGVMLPLSIELLLLFLFRSELQSLTLPLKLSLLPTLSLTVILIYYFRLAVRSFEGAKAQLSQIELRKTMCRFVESYAEFAKRIKADNAETLVKFESMIFSNIVGSDDKLPATFDGVEQLSALIKSVKT